MADYELYKRDWSIRNMYASSTITDKSSWEGLVHFNPQKREFSLLLNIPRRDITYRTITRTTLRTLHRNETVINDSRIY